MGLDRDITRELELRGQRSLNFKKVLILVKHESVRREHFAVHRDACQIQLLGVKNQSGVHRRIRSALDVER